MIGVFDSGFGGLTILQNLKKVLPDYDFLYLGDNARAPYGSRSFETIYRYTLQAVRELFGRGCPLVILACNTASARALRSIQQDVLPYEFPDKRVLGIIRPTTEEIGHFSKTGHIGIFATSGTVSSNSYGIEIHNFFPDLKVTQHACPMWVPLVEYGERGTEGAAFFVKKEVDALLAEDPQIDTVLLACTRSWRRRYAPHCHRRFGWFSRGISSRTRLSITSGVTRRWMRASQRAEKPPTLRPIRQNSLKKVHFCSELREYLPNR